MSDVHYSFWLIPQEPDLTDLQTIIQTLASRFGTIPFCPHVTIYSGPVNSEVDIKQVSASLTPMDPIELGIIRLAHETRFSKTLYVQLQSSPLLTQLVEQLVATLPNAQRPAPHISLLYHRLAAVTKQEIIDTIVLPRLTVRFNQIQVIAAPKNFETQEDVAKLRCVHSQLLTTP